MLTYLMCIHITYEPLQHRYMRMARITRYKVRTHCMHEHARWHDLYRSHVYTKVAVCMFHALFVYIC